MYYVVTAYSVILLLIVTFRVRPSRGEMYIVSSFCVSVCVSLAAFPHYCTDPGMTWGNGRVGQICNRCMDFFVITT